MQFVTVSPEFGKVAARYERYRTAYSPAFFRRILSLAPHSNPTVLDVGCGTGKSTFGLTQRGTRVVGCDPDGKMLREARRVARRLRKKVRFVRCRAERLPFPNASFDMVTVGTAFHWFDKQRSLREIKRVLRPGGAVVVYWARLDHQLFNKRNLSTVFKGLSWRPSGVSRASDNRRALHAAGFTSVHRASLHYSEHYSLTSWLGEIQTTSYYVKLRQNERAIFNKRAREVLLQRMHGRQRILEPRTIRYRWGFKPTA